MSSNEKEITVRIGLSRGAMIIRVVNFFAQNLFFVYDDYYRLFSI